MSTFSNFHPAVLFSYFFFVIFISIFSFNPIVLIIGFTGALFFSLFIFDKKKLLKSFGFYLLIFTAISLTNPLFSHNGATVLFFINDNRVTLEALIYGGVLGLTVIEVILWFKIVNKIFDSEKLIYIFGRAFPKIALVISMTLKFIPDFVRSFKEINNALRLSLKCGRLKRYTLSFSAVITQSMENALITSDSMRSRGYCLKPRSFYYRFKFTAFDGVYLLVSAGLFILSLVFKTDFTYYPEFSASALGIRTISGYIFFAALSFMPFIYELKEGIRWKFLISKI